MNLKQAKSLLRGTSVHYTGKHECTRSVGPRGRVTITVTNCRVSGEPQTWKRSPEKVKVPIKYGRYENSYITEENLQDWHLEVDCPLLAEEEPSSEPKRVRNFLIQSENAPAMECPPGFLRLHDECYPDPEAPEPILEEAHLD